MINSPSLVFCICSKWMNSTITACQSTSRLPPTKTQQKQNELNKLIPSPWPGLYLHTEIAVDYFTLVLPMDSAGNILLQVGHTTG